MIDDPLTHCHQSNRCGSNSSYASRACAPDPCSRRILRFLPMWGHQDSIQWLDPSTAQGIKISHQAAAARQAWGNAEIMPWNPNSIVPTCHYNVPKHSSIQTKQQVGSPHYPGKKTIAAKTNQVIIHVQRTEQANGHEHHPSIHWTNRNNKIQTNVQHMAQKVLLLLLVKPD